MLPKARKNESDAAINKSNGKALVYYFASFAQRCSRMVSIQCSISANKVNKVIEMTLFASKP